MTESEPKPTPETPIEDIPAPESTPPIPEPPRNRMKLGDLVSLTTVAITISAAVFYIAGWIYEAYWYGFFGINVTQINIPLQQMMVEGLPGILVIVISFFISHLLFSIRRRKKEGDSKNSDILWTIFLAYGISAGIVLLIGLLNFKYLYPVPIEIIVSGLGLLIVLLILFGLLSLRNNRIASLLEASMEISPLLINIGFSSMLLGGLLAIPVSESFLSQLKKSIKYQDLVKKYVGHAENLMVAIINAWRIWIGLIILFFLFLSLTTSAILGRANGHFGHRLMIGGWKISETYIVSNSSDLPLPKSFNVTINNSNAFGPFALIAYNDQIYYLAEWKSNGYYENRPDIYIVPRSNDPALEVLFVPQPTPTPRPTITVTSRPKATSTPSATIKPMTTQTATSTP